MLEFYLNTSKLALTDPEEGKVTFSSVVLVVVVMVFIPVVIPT